MPTYTEFYCDPQNGSNVNAGSDSGSPSMSDTAGTGSWTSTTQVYVSVATNGTVTPGQFLAIYSGAATVPTTIAQILTATGGSGSAWTITVSNTIYSGTQPSSLATAATYKAQVGGAWKGPNGASAHPFNFIQKQASVSSNPVRVNFKNSATYAITAAMTITSSANMDILTFQGYSSSPGDGGVAIIDGGTSGVSYTPLSVGTSAAGVTIRDFKIQNNGATGTAAGLSNANNLSFFERITVCNVRGAGFLGSAAIVVANECEAFNCNQSNTATTGGFLSTVGLHLIGCTSHHNTGSNNCGFVGAGIMSDCIADSNGLHGFLCSTGNSLVDLRSCTMSNNGGDGFRSTVTTTSLRAINSIFSVNAGFGVNMNAALTAAIARLTNCAYWNNGGDGSGTAHQTQNINDISGSITLIGDPFVSDATGNFVLNNTAGAGAACRAAGAGTFIETPTRSGNVTGATNANPTVITTDQPHGMSSGATATIAAVGGNTGANGTWTITNISATTFSIPVNTTAGGAYTSGGTWSTPQYSATTTSLPDVGAAQVSDSGTPATSDVRNGTVYGGGTGTLVVPAASNVKTGVVFDNGTVGTLPSGGGGNSVIGLGL